MGGGRRIFFRGYIQITSKILYWNFLIIFHCQLKTPPTQGCEIKICNLVMYLHFGLFFGEVLTYLFLSSHKWGSNTNNKTDSRQSKTHFVIIFFLNSKKHLKASWKLLWQFLLCCYSSQIFPLNHSAILA